jgi:cytochrome b561
MHSVPSNIATPGRYTAAAIAMHWVLGLALIALFAFGLYMTSLPFSPTRLKYFNWHKWAGMTILFLSMARLLWRVTHRPPALPQAITASMPGWQRAAHHGVHHLMYALFFAIPLLGWMYSSAAGFPIVLFGQIPLPDLVGKNPELAEALKPWHAWLAYALAALVVLHIAAALKHQLIDRDGLVHRMLPWGR